MEACSCLPVRSCWAASCAESQSAWGCFTNGCVDGGAYVARPSAARVIVNGNGISTDGRLLVLQASDCDVPAGTSVSEPFRPTGNLFKKTVRRVVLEGRQYVERANPIFLGYRAIQWRRDWRRRDYAEE
jgi:hypothetical protein